MSTHQSSGGIIESRTFNLPVDNIDTDRIIPGKYTKTVDLDIS